MLLSRCGGGPRRAGDGRVIGTVVSAEGGRPLSGARIGIRNGPTTQADERGAFTLSGIPTGTRMLDVRAVSYAPVALPVDVVEGGAPLRIELALLKSVLDTVKVRANLSVNRDYEGFLRRQKHGGAGRFITTDDIARRNPIQAVDLLRSMPGILIARDDNQLEILAQRSPQNVFVPFCRVAVIVNGNPIREPTVNDINGYLRPNQMLGVEIYDAGAAPAEFSRRNGCGVVVIWTR
ncbi:MAG: carboxypeptidase regulatory-like domain-containing protein [Gemmatimonadaceae bacterium]|nr:carboxypeptidase regulatory-like domain-containing protein [Gemmatimonadaceae bacterium]